MNMARDGYQNMQSQYVSRDMGMSHWIVVIYKVKFFMELATADEGLLK
jgi:hypothetical protein